MSKHEVTNSQYTEFLNAMAATDTFALYNTIMDSGTKGGITRSGSSGSYTYAVKADAVGQGPGGSDYTYANKPVGNVSWYDAVRFANWLTSGTTETGTYTITGGGVNSGTVAIPDHSTLGAGAIFLPSEDEWYKAAYYNGSTGTYFDYAIGTDTAPNNNLPSADTGNSANYSWATGDIYYPLTDVGAYGLSASPYGTFDQTGNVHEWTEAWISVPGSDPGSYRGIRGGHHTASLHNIGASKRGTALSTEENFFFGGFRIAASAEATTVPEPSAYAMAVLGLLGLGLFAWRRKRAGKNMAIALSAIVTLVFFAQADAVQAITIEWATVGDLGNAADTTSFGPFGSVDYEYRISKHEVTNAQYVEFLNAVAASDPYALFSPNMTSGTRGGIIRSGSPGSYSYSVKPDAIEKGPGATDYTYAQKPVIRVSWYDALRFSNWLTGGDTESGTYTITGGGANSGTIAFPHHSTLGPGHVFLPTEDEWYKAAYYDGGGSSTYFKYPTSTDTTPNNNLPFLDTGNSANFEDNGYTTGDFYYSNTDVGAYSLSTSPYGTFDQGGNVLEWVVRSASSHGLRGGWFGSGDSGLSTWSYTFTGNPAVETVFTGFRVGSSVETAVSPVPEPSTYAMAAIGLLGLGLMSWQRKGGWRRRTR